MDPMATFITDIASVFTAVIGYVGTVINLFTSNIVLTLIFGVVVSGIVVRLAMKLLHKARR